MRGRSNRRRGRECWQDFSVVSNQEGEEKKTIFGGDCVRYVRNQSIFDYFGLLDLTRNDVYVTPWGIMKTKFST